MGTKYSSNSISGYNSTPPSDDGTQSEANKIKWSTIKNKLTDPIKTLAETINSEVATALDYGPVSLVSASLAIGASHHNQLIEMSGAATPTLASAAALGAGWFVDIKNIGTQAITIARTNSAVDTINQVTADLTLNALDYIRLAVNAAATGFVLGGTRIATQAQVDAGDASDVFVTPKSLYNASIFRGALVYSDTPTTCSDGIETDVFFNQDDYDTDNIHDTTTNEERLVVPSGVTRVKLLGQVDISANSTGERQVRVLKNGSNAYPGNVYVTYPATGSGTFLTNVNTSALTVTSGDYFTLAVTQNSGSNLTVLVGSSVTWFAMEILE